MKTWEGFNNEWGVNIRTSNIQAIITSKLCKWGHIVGVVGQVMSLLRNALCSLQDAVVAGGLKGSRSKKNYIWEMMLSACWHGVKVFAFLKWHLEFFKLPQNHVVWHVVKEAVTRRQDDVAKLHVERGAVSSIGTGRQTGGDKTRFVTSGSGA